MKMSLRPDGFAFPRFLGAIFVLLTGVGCQSPPSGGTLYDESGLAVMEDPMGGLAGPVEGADTEVRRAQAVGGETLFTDSRSWNLPGSDVSLHDVALMLAGMWPNRAHDGMDDVRQLPAWHEHKRVMDGLWQDYGLRHEGPIRQWAAAEMPDLARSRSVFYPFSGPDVLFAQAFFPRAGSFILCGLEGADTLPGLNQLSPAEMERGLENLRTSINSVMQFSFFITKDMRNDLVASRFRGVLPVMLVFLARSGYRIETVDAVRLTAAGDPQIVQVEQGSAPGLMIRCRAPNGALVQVFYIKQNLANDGIKSDHPLLKFVRQSNARTAFVKSASYLMHESYFSVIRDFLLNECTGLVQDPSGIPYRFFADSAWSLRLYGNYSRTLDLFGEKAQQPDLRAAYEAGLHGAQPLPYGIGYLYRPENTALMIGRR